MLSPLQLRSVRLIHVDSRQTCSFWRSESASFRADSAKYNCAKHDVASLTYVTSTIQKDVFSRRLLDLAPRADSGAIYVPARGKNPLKSCDPAAAAGAPDSRPVLTYVRFERWTSLWGTGRGNSSGTMPIVKAQPIGQANLREED